MTDLAKGISLYPGLEHSLEENLEQLRTAAEMGISRLFLSFHIPETDPAAFGETVQPLLRAARAWDMETVGDLVPGNPVPEELTALRLDDGFTGADMAELQQKYPGRKLVLNASAMNREQLRELAREGVDFSRVEALHNFYPHPHTGLSEGYLLQQNTLFHEAGIPVGAFVAKPGDGGPWRRGSPPWNRTGIGRSPWRPGSWQPWGPMRCISGTMGRTGRNWRHWPGFLETCWN